MPTNITTLSEFETAIASASLTVYLFGMSWKGPSKYMTTTFNDCETAHPEVQFYIISKYPTDILTRAGLPGNPLKKYAVVPAYQIYYNNSLVDTLTDCITPSALEDFINSRL
jgi:hypothetical protein